MSRLESEHRVGHGSMPPEMGVTRGRKELYAEIAVFVGAIASPFAIARVLSMLGNRRSKK